MWISKKEYFNIKNKLDSLERQVKGNIRVKIKGIKEPNSNVLSAYTDNSHTYIGIEKAIQLILEHLRLEYEPVKTHGEAFFKSEDKCQ